MLQLYELVCRKTITMAGIRDTATVASDRRDRTDHDTTEDAVAENVDTPTVLLLTSHTTDSIATSLILTRLLEDELVGEESVRAPSSLSSNA